MRARSPEPGRPRLRLALLLLAAAVLAAVLVGAQAWRRAEAARASLHARLQSLQPAPGPDRSDDCRDWLAQQPLVLWAIGQSNAANHGAPATGPAPPVRVLHGGRCLWTGDPLPGGTGGGGSIWSRLPAQLAAQLPRPWRDRPVVLAVLAVDATTLDDWLRADSPLRALLLRTAGGFAATGLQPALVLWQQGEADGRAGTSSADVQQRLRAFAELLAGAGIDVPWMLARSTVCRSAPDAGVRDAVQTLVAQGRRFVDGPDTDTLAGPALRHDGCHFSGAGLDAAAVLWGRSLAAYFALHSPPPSAPR